MSEAKGQKMRALLLVGIGAVLLATAAVQYMFTTRKNAAVEAEANRPERRAQEALLEADRAAGLQDVRLAWHHVEQARAALDEALAQRPDDEALLRGRLNVARRLAYLAQNRNMLPEARKHLDDAVARAQALFAGAKSDDRARADRLGTAHDLAKFLADGDTTAPAIAALTAAFADLTPTFETLAPDPKLATGLAVARVTLAEAHLAADDRAAALAAVAKAVERAETTARSDLDPVGDLGRLSQILGRASTIAERAGDPAAALRYDHRLIEVLDQRAALTPSDQSLVRARAARHVRVGDAELKAGRLAAAQAAYEAAVADREKLSAAAPADMEARAAWIRALSRLGLFHSQQKANERALALYAQAAELAEQLDDSEARTKLLALGNHAQLLGRLDQMVESKRVAAAAFALADRLRQAAPSDPARVEDAAVAALRHARLMRARPKPQRKPARALAEQALGWLDALAKPSARAKSAREGLESLVRELR